MLFGHIKNALCREAIRLGTSFIPGRQRRRQIRRTLLHKYSPVSFTIYDDPFPVYPPHYSGKKIPSGTEPEIYNKDGERMRTFFFRDHFASYFPIGISRYFLCDRYNIGLDTHFYGHSSMLETMGKPSRRYGYFYETSAVTPDDYKIFEQNPGLHKDFDLIFTHERRLVEKYDNARFWPNWAYRWIPDALCDAGLVDRKTRSASIVSSDKSVCRLHDLRRGAAKYCRAHPELGVDAFGTFEGGGGGYVPIQDSLLEYRYSIAVENHISPWLFTERLINCFATCTVPIYVGAGDVGRFFNTDGIIRIAQDELTDIKKVVAQCSEADYAARREAVLDNFRRAAEYGTHPWNYLYEHYLR